MKYVKGVLEEQAELFQGIAPEALKPRYPCDLGVFYERAKPRFSAVVPEPLLRAWVGKNHRDPIRDFPWPSDLTNSHFWAHTQAEKNGIAVLPYSSADTDVVKMGYKGFRVYGTSEAETHLRNSLRAHIQKQVPAARRSGAQHIGDVLKETLDDLM